VIPLLLDTLSYIFSKLVPGLSGLLMVVIFMRLLGVTEYGRYSSQFSTVLFAGALLVGWFNQAQLRFFSGRDGNFEFQRYCVTRISWGLLLVVGVIAVICLLIRLWHNAWEGPSLAALVLLFVYGTYLLRLVAWQARLQTKRYVLAEGIRAVFALGLPLVIVYLWDPKHQALLLGLTGAFLVPLIFFPAPWKGVPDSGKGKISIKDCWQFGWPMSLWLACMAAFQAGDRWLITLFYGYQVTGSYAGVQELVIRAYSLLVFPITLAVHPRIMSAYNQQKFDSAYRYLRQAMVWQLLLLIPIGIAFLLGAERLLLWLMPNLSSVSLQLVWPLALAGFLWQFALLVHKPLEIAGQTRWILLGIMVALCVHLVLDAYLLPIWGFFCVPWISVISAIIYIGFCLMCRFRVPEKKI
jgi:O-antigen/teichoic acid export membrane protein